MKIPYVTVFSECACLEIKKTGNAVRHYLFFLFPVLITTSVILSRNQNLSGIFPHLYQINTILQG